MVETVATFMVTSIVVATSNSATTDNYYIRGMPTLVAFMGVSSVSILMAATKMVVTSVAGTVAT